jgi:hypothetical protein
MTPDELAQILQGEAGLCSQLGLWAVLWVWTRNPTMYGRQDPSHLARVMAHIYFSQPAWLQTDPTGGANFLLSGQDLQQSRVKRLIGEKHPVFELKCKGGLTIYGYR